MKGSLEGKKRETAHGSVRYRAQKAWNEDSLVTQTFVFIGTFVIHPCGMPIA
jgi:hypothetical protein